MPTVPQVIDVDLKAIERVLLRVQPLVLPEDFELLSGLVDTLARRSQLVRERGSTIARLRRLFGLKGTEKTRDVVGPSETTQPAPEQPAAAHSPGAEPPAVATPSSSERSGTAGLNDR